MRVGMDATLILAVGAVQVIKLNVIKEMCMDIFLRYLVWVLVWDLGLFGAHFIPNKLSAMSVFGAYICFIVIMATRRGIFR